MRALLFAVVLVLLLSPALAASSRADAERPRRDAHTLRAVPQALVCPPVPVSRSQPRHRLHHAAGLSLGGAAGPKPRTQALAAAGVWAQMSYAVQFKAGLSEAERDAAVATLRHKYPLKIVKFQQGLDVLRVRPRVPPKRAPKSVGAALTPKVIQDLRKEPFVDAAYVDFPVSPPRALKARSKPRAAR